MRKLPPSAIILRLSIRRKFLQSTSSDSHWSTSTRTSKPAFSFRARSERLQLLEKRTCGFFRRGIVFAASRCAGRDEAGTLRAAALISSTGGQRVRRRLSKKFCGRTGRIQTLSPARQSCFRTDERFFGASCATAKVFARRALPANYLAAILSSVRDEGSWAIKKKNR